MISAVVLSAAGCRSPRPGGLAEEIRPREPVYIFLPAARVLHVNKEDEYVILQCTALPSPGKEAKVYRDSKLVARLRILERRRGPFVAADILSGTVQCDDLVKFNCPVSGNF